MIPYIQFQNVRIGPLSLHPFGLLVAAGVAIGVALARRRGRALKLPANELASFITWMLVSGFFGAHVLDTLLYHPDEAARRPWSLLCFWSGLSSFGGFVGGTVGVLLWRSYDVLLVDVSRWFSIMLPVRRRAPLKILPYCDVVLAVFPVAWIFGRLGCTVTHDHPGLVAQTWMPLSVAYGPGPTRYVGPLSLRYGSVPRFDLGLLEMLFAVALSVFFAFNWSKPRPVGWYVVLVSLAYAPVRFSLDFLRLDNPAGGDLRYAALTPAQWACLGLLILGVALSWELQRHAQKS